MTVRKDSLSHMKVVIILSEASLLDLCHGHR